MVVEFYDALRKAGVDADLAKAAASAVLGAEERATFATKGDLVELRSALTVDMAEMKADLIKWNAGLLVAMTAIFAGIVKFL